MHIQTRITLAAALPFFFLFALNSLISITSEAGSHVYHNIKDMPGSPSPFYAGDCTGNGAYFFDGVDQYLSISDHPALDLDHDFTIECWHKPASEISPDEIRPIVTKHDQDSTKQQYMIGWRNDESGVGYAGVYLRISSGGDNPSTASDLWKYVFDPGIQYHLAATYTRSTGGVEVFVNGVSQGEKYGFPTSVYNSDEDFRIGGSGEDVYYHGSIDEVRISNVVRTASEILDHYAEGDELTVDANTIALWHMNGDISTSQKKDDAGPDSFDLTEMNDPTAAAGFNECDDPARDCVDNGAYFLNGYDQYLSTPDTNLIEIGSSDFTIEAWIKMESIKGQCIIDKIDADGGYRLELGHGSVSGSDLVIIFKQSSDSISEYRAVDIFSSEDIGVFHYIAVSVSTGDPSASIYIDGVPADVTATTEEATYVDSTDVDFQIGATNTLAPAEFFHGTIDGVRVSNVARTASEIADHYASGIELGVDPNTIALWCMNGDAGTSQKKDDKGFYSLDLTEANDPTADFSFICAMPITPENFSGIPVYSGGDLTALLLTWDSITVPEFSHFSLHRDTFESFVPDLSNLIAEAPDTFYYDLNWHWMPHYVYKLCSNNTNTLKSDYSILTYNDIYAGDDIPQMANVLKLYQNAPNPFNPTTTIRFDLPRAAHVKLCMYNVKGELVTTLVDRHMTGGCKEVGWNAKDSRGREVASGIYFYRLTAGGFVQTRKMVLLR